MGAALSLLFSSEPRQNHVLCLSFFLADPPATVFLPASLELLGHSGRDPSSSRRPNSRLTSANEGRRDGLRSQQATSRLENPMGHDLSSLWKEEGEGGRWGGGGVRQHLKEGGDTCSDGEKEGGSHFGLSPPKTTRLMKSSRPMPLKGTRSRAICHTIIPKL